VGVAVLGGGVMNTPSHAYSLGFARGVIEAAIRSLQAGTPVAEIVAKLERAIDELAEQEAARDAEYEARMAAGEARIAQLRAVSQ